MTTNLLTARDLYFATERSELFSGLNLTIREGDCIEIQGPNGSGKSTLLRVLANLQRPDSGKVVRFTEQIGYMGHRRGLSDLLSPSENLRWILAMARKQLPIESQQEKMAEFGVLQYARGSVAGLSAGEVKRCALVGLLLAEYKLWLLDEPLASLDREGEQTFRNALAEHCQSGGAAAIATHLPLAIGDLSPIELPRA